MSLNMGIVLICRYENFCFTHPPLMIALSFVFFFLETFTLVRVRNFLSRPLFYASKNNIFSRRNENDVCQKILYISFAENTNIINYLSIFCKRNKL